MGWMSKTNILPKITVDVLPVIGLAIAYDKNPMKWIIILPFLTIEFKTKQKDKL
jgi:hypothetical protein